MKQTENFISSYTKITLSIKHFPPHQKNYNKHSPSHSICTLQRENLTKYTEWWQIKTNSVVVAPDLNWTRWMSTSQRRKRTTSTHKILNFYLLSPQTSQAERILPGILLFTLLWAPLLSPAFQFQFSRKSIFSCTLLNSFEPKYLWRDIIMINNNDNNIKDRFTWR